MTEITVEEVKKHFEDLKGYEWAKESIESTAVVLFQKEI